MLALELTAIAAAAGSLAALWIAAVHRPLLCLAFGACSTLEARAEVAAVSSAVVLAVLVAILLATRKLPTYAAAVPAVGIMALVISAAVAYDAVIGATGGTPVP